ncbi:uncharacterized protein LOC114275929 isoform X2 [Camellia sinensis]|uniref:uncharacterized protein LOC114275929 isoform X2 n=1 Tax=Camellia sinensis TaxID=4442 RepID=UPI001035DBF8|nr:uncharacterized protein LOC114275929 isoform X2 [Camellia sinensis]
MEAKLRTKNQNQYSLSKPFTGIFTRSKAQIYVHRTRSGQARSDAIRKRHHHLDLHSSQSTPRKRRAQSEQHEASDIDNISQISIKDLRARRVFSPAAIVNNECCSNGSFGDLKDSNISDSDSGEIKLSQMKAQVEKFDLGFCGKPNLQSVIDHGCADRGDADGAFLGGVEPVEDGWKDKFEEGFSCRANDLDAANPNFLEIRGEGGVCDVEQRSDDGKVENLTEECIQMTPPDAGMSSEPNLNENTGNGDRNGDISKGTACGNDSIDQRNHSISKNKLVLYSHTQPKVFKTPSSFSYRRLLPFLTDIAKVDPCVSKIEESGLGVSCKDQRLNGAKPKFSSIMGNCCSPKDENGGAYSDRRKPSENGEIKNLDTELSCKAQNWDHPHMSEAEGNTQLHNVDQRSNEDGNFPNGVDELIEDIQMTPPDVDIFSKPEVNDNRGNNEDIDLHTEDHILGKVMKGSFSRNDIIACEGYCKNVNRKNDCNLKSNLILNPRSRLKVFKTPSSFSYRRLLPFLMDIRNNDSYNSSDASKCTQSPKAENVSEEKIHLPASASHCQGVPMEISKTDYSPTVHHTGDSKLNPPAAILMSNNDSSNNELILTSAENIIEPWLPFDTQKECKLQVELVISDKPISSEPAPDGVCSDLETASPAMSVCSSVSRQTLHGDGAVEFSHCVSIASQEDCTTLPREHSKDTKSNKAVSLDENSSQLEAFIPTEVPVDGLTKGILRRNPRGCRGLCNCLNCASFRLHADRAFEFSRNQMQDAEEIAFNLITEVSYLRNMLEKSAVDAHDHAIAHINQVKEACTKAFKVEELAKCRLNQMNDDLSFHCRSTRPRVKFADYVEEIVIPNGRRRLAKQTVEKNKKEDGRS